MTKDLALLVGPEQPWLTTEKFLEALDAKNCSTVWLGRSLQPSVSGYQFVYERAKNV